MQLDHPDGQSGALNLAAPMRIAINPALANVVFQVTGKRPQVFPLTPQPACSPEAITWLWIRLPRATRTWAWNDLMKTL